MTIRTFSLPTAAFFLRNLLRQDNSPTDDAVPDSAATSPSTLWVIFFAAGMLTTMCVIPLCTVWIVSRWRRAMRLRQNVHVVQLTLSPPDTQQQPSPSFNRDLTVPNSVSMSTHLPTLLPDAPSDPADVCPICLAALDAENRIVSAPCQHRAHAQCLALWLAKDPRMACPICRAPVVRESDGML